MPRRVDQCDIANYLDKWSTCYLENVCGDLYEAIVWQFITSYGRDPAQVAVYSSLVSDKRTTCSLVNDNEAS